MGNVINMIGGGKSTGQYVWEKYSVAPPAFSNATSWADIGGAIASDINGDVDLSKHWNIGDTKDVTLTTGETIQLQIAGFNHDTFSDGVTAPVTFVMKDCLNTEAVMNEIGTNGGGYPASSMKTYVETNIYDKLPSDFKGLVAPVKKKWYTTYNKEQSLTEGNYNVWLLSEREVFGTSPNTVGSGEGTKYPIFTDNNSRIKKINGTAVGWWLGSCYRSDSLRFVLVHPRGYSSYFDASGPLGVVVGLCPRGTTTLQLQKTFLSYITSDLESDYPDGGMKDGYYYEKVLPPFNPSEISWANGTDAQIAEMVAAADAGKINLSDYWSVGDTRTVQLSAMSATGVDESHNAQTVELVLMHAGGYDLNSAVASGRSKCSFIVGMKNCLATGGYMNSSETNSGSWDGSARRTWCNNVFKAAMPSTLLPIFKQFKTITAESYNGMTLKTSVDWFALPAEKEVSGGPAGYSNPTEFNALFQFDWYKTASNKIKKRGMTGSSNLWWERSPYYDGSGGFCCVHISGSAYVNAASNTFGLTPFGCI